MYLSLGLRLYANFVLANHLQIEQVQSALEVTDFDSIELGQMFQKCLKLLNDNDRKTTSSGD